MAPWSVSGFRALPLKITSNSLTAHSLYIKEHSVREQNESKPNNKTLFVLNIPPFVDEATLTKLFSKVGNVKSLQLSDKPTSSDIVVENTIFKKACKTNFKVAYVVYEKESDLQKALRLDELKPESDASVGHRGVLKWIKEYNNSIPDLSKMKEEIDQAVKSYDREAKEKAEKEKTLGEADDEGWVTVTKQGRKPGFERKESVTNKILANKNAQRQKKELKNFYTFQIRESKMNHIIALRQKFEEDKKKIAVLKQSRRFRPF